MSGKPTRARAAAEPADDVLTFQTTLAGDTVLLDDEEMEVVQKFHAERRLRLRTTKGGARERVMQEFDYNRARPQLARGKGRP